MEVHNESYKSRYDHVTPLSPAARIASTSNNILTTVQDSVRLQFGYLND